MKFTEYAPLALRTAKPLPHDLQVQHAQLGAVTEIGEFADAVKRHFIYGKAFDKVNAAEEIGDIAWYLNLYCEEQGIHCRVVAGWIDAPLPVSHLETLVEISLGVAGLIGALCIPVDERGASDTDVLKLTFGLLNHACLGFLDTTFDDVLDKNIAKLAARYGDKYSDYAALNRNTGAERTILENPQP